MNTNFRRWNRSRAKYDKAFRKYQFDQHNKDIEEWLSRFGEPKSLLKQLKKIDPNITKHLSTWMAATPQHTPEVSPVDTKCGGDIDESENRKDTYSAWQQCIVDHYLNLDISNNQVTPTIGNPTKVTQQKIILVVDPILENGELASTQDVSSLPPKSKYKVYHSGKGKEDKVSYGYDDEDDVSKLIAIDLGGLTNLKIKPGETPQFIGTTQTYMKGDSLEKYAGPLFAEWRNLSKTNIGVQNLGSQEDEDNLKKVLNTIQNNFINKNDFRGVEFKFKLQPPANRVLVCPQDIVRLTGHYYVRDFGDKKVYATKATPSQLKTLYCAVDAKGFVTPNINDKNIKNEYVSRN